MIKLLLIMRKKIFIQIIILLFHVVFSQDRCIKNTVKDSFSAKIQAKWRVAKANKFKVEIVVFVNSLYDVFAKFSSTAGENFEIYKFKNKIAIFEKNTGKWIPYNKNIYLSGIKLLNLRKLFLQVIKIVNKTGSDFSKCVNNRKSSNFYTEKEDVENILSFLFDRNEIPQESNSNITIICSCNDKLQSIFVQFNIVDKETKIKGNVKITFLEYGTQYVYNIPEGIKKFLRK